MKGYPNCLFNPFRQFSCNKLNVFLLLTLLGLVFTCSTCACFNLLVKVLQVALDQLLPWLLLKREFPLLLPEEM